MADIRISSGIMCWNEAQTLDLSLKSIADFVDEVIIVDTGSIDGTPGIAQEWIDRLDLCGEVHHIKTKNIGEARAMSIDLCTGDWILMQDAQLVLSDALKFELKFHAKHYQRDIGAIRSLNLMGDYEHYFDNRPWMAYHKIWFSRNIKQSPGRYRPDFKGIVRNTRNWAVNLSRLRPAWRYWLRGEQFDRRYYGEKQRRSDYGDIHKGNIQDMWARSKKYYDIIEYVEAKMGLSLDEVKRIAPEWYLDLCRIEAKPLTVEMRDGLPQVIKDELKNPRYKLVYEDNEIIRRDEIRKEIVETETPESN